MASKCLIARHKLAQYVSELAGKDAHQKVASGVRAGFLLGVVTPAKAVGGNAVEATLRNVFEMPVQAGLDYVAAVSKSARTGFKVRPAEFRETLMPYQSYGVYARGLKAGAKGLWSDAREAWQSTGGTPFAKHMSAWMDDMRARQALHVAPGSNDVIGSAFSSPAGKVLGDGAFLAADAADRPYMTAARNMSLHMQARLKAVQLRAKTLRAGGRWDASDLAKTTEDFYNNPTETMQIQALVDARDVTFKNSTWLGGKMSTVQQATNRAAQATAKSTDPLDIAMAKAKAVSGKAGNVAISLIAPFTGVPTSAVAKAVSRFPGTAALNPNLWGSMAEGASRQGMTRSLARNITGVGGIALGYEWYKRGWITKGAANDPNTRADEIETSKRTPYSVKVGGYWANTQLAFPSMAMVYIGAELAGAFEEDANMTTGEAAGVAASAMGKLTIDNAYFRNISESIKAVQDGGGRAKSFLLNGMPVPSLLGQVGRATDPFERDAQTLSEKMMARTPLRSLVPARPDVLGRTIERTPLERASALLPIRLSKDRDTESLKELRRLGLSIGKPERKTKVKGQSVEIERDAYNDMVRRQGDGLDARLQSVIDSPEYAQKNDEQRAKWLKRVIQHQRDRARAPIRRGLITGNTP